MTTNLFPMFHSIRLCNEVRLPTFCMGKMKCFKNCLKAENQICFCRELTSKTVCNDIKDALKEGQEKHFEILYYRKDGKWIALLFINFRSRSKMNKKSLSSVDPTKAERRSFFWWWCHKVLRAKMSQKLYEMKKKTDIIITGKSFSTLRCHCFVDYFFVLNLTDLI